MHVRSFTLRSHTASVQVKEKIQNLLSAWCLDWQLPSGMEVMSTQPKSHLLQTANSKHHRFSNIYLSGFEGDADMLKDFHLFTYSEVTSKNDVDACVMCSFDVSNMICGLLYPECESDDSDHGISIDSLTVRLLSNLYLDLLNRIEDFSFKQTLTELEEIEEQCLSPGNGSLVLRISIGNSNFYVMLASHLIDRLAESPVRGSTRVSGEVIAKPDYENLHPDSLVNLSVRLPPTNCKIDLLQKMKVGDVLSIDCELDDPIDLYVDSVKVNQRVYLGVDNARRAIKIHSLE